MFAWHWQLLNNSLLLNNHAQFQNIHGEEMSPFKNVTTQYVQVMLNLCLTIYIYIYCPLLNENSLKKRVYLLLFIYFKECMSGYQ